MTPDQQRIAIAEARGYSRFYVDEDESMPGRYGMEFDGWKTPSGRLTTTLPNYPQDLNAIHEARKVLVTTTELRVKYLNTLRAIVGRRCPKNTVGAPLVSDYDLVNAEAWEHAETLVKVAGKWVES